MLQLSIGNEKFFYVKNEGEFNLVSLNLYDTIRFIDSILAGDLRKEVIPDLRNGAFAYYTKESNELVGFSLLGFVGFNEFCRKVYEFYDRSETKVRNEDSIERNKGIFELISRFAG